ncbi:uncharacterized protein LOC132697276 [Cylas formicarius]|uniref:uncharacterized protein LOC132697276 n=1 Tax=Cylas formicarius TaxID=197179 RepID=UPI0029589B9F|nr:uncharacterized protein LOC132697276 [Cylas formicarius]
MIPPPPPPPVKECRTRTSFLYTVLSALDQLQTQHGRSIKLDALIKYMERHYKLDGDVKSQVQSALFNAELTNFIVRRNDRYSTVSPAANIHLIGADCRKREMKRIQGLFNVTRKRKRSPSPPDQGPSSGGAIDTSCFCIPKSANTPKAQRKKRSPKAKSKSRTMPNRSVQFKEERRNADSSVEDAQKKLPDICPCPTNDERSDDSSSSDSN